jgi:putative nucleotidyltransferase with HDIG domain
MSDADDLKRRVQELQEEARRLKAENETFRANLESLVNARTEQLQGTVRDLKRSYDVTLEALGDALENKDGETEGHARRVCLFGIALSQAMGLAQERVTVIARGGFLHDIGKMAIPDSILLKPGELEPHERAIMKEHAYHGYQIVAKIPFLAGEAADIVYSHHEWFNGEGYPRRLRGEEIPLGARIVAIVNAFDSITCDLPYRAARTFSVARKEIAMFAASSILKS